MGYVSLFVGGSFSFLAPVFLGCFFLVVDVGVCLAHLLLGVCVFGWWVFLLFVCWCVLVVLFVGGSVFCMVDTGVGMVACGRWRTIERKGWC